MIVKPAPEGTGIRFVRTDIGADAVVDADAALVSNTARSTTLSRGDISVVTVEHISSALFGLGVDNAIVELDNVEVPILDGSARMYAEAITADGLLVQDAPRKVLVPKETIEVKDGQSGSWVRIEPSDSLSFDVTVDFGSRVLGVQSVHWDPSVDYAREIAPCRTFVFFHEIEFLFNNNLVKGGDVDNAIIIVENPVTDAQLDRLSVLFNKEKLDVGPAGYLDNAVLHFPDECGRHKLLDLIGDISLAGHGLCARVSAFKPGHSINTRAARALAESLAR